MGALTELHTINADKEYQQLQINYDELKHQYFNVIEQFQKRVLNEATDLSFSDNHDSLLQLDQSIEKLYHMFKAARKGLGLTNQLKPGPERSKHRSQVMSNMNRIRFRLTKLQQQLEDFINNFEDSRPDSVSKDTADSEFRRFNVDRMRA